MNSTRHYSLFPDNEYETQTPEEAAEHRRRVQILTEERARRAAALASRDHQIGTDCCPACRAAASAEGAAYIADYNDYAASQTLA